jgi:SCY1-like protein 2
MAPEYSTTKSYDSQSDMFSLGMLIYALYNHGKTLYECNDNYSAFVRMSDDLKNLNTAKLSVLPMEVREHVKMLLSIRPELRPDARQFAKVNSIERFRKKTIRSNYLGTFFRRCRNKNIRISRFIISS